MTIQELKESDYVMMFNLKFEGDRMRIPSPHWLSWPIDNAVIREGNGLIEIEIKGKYAITLYKDSRSIHLVII